MFYGELESLRQKGVLETNTHVSYGSDFHSTIRINTDLLFINPQLYKRYAFKLAAYFLDKNIQIVAGQGYKNSALVQIVGSIIANLENRPVYCICTEDNFDSKTFKSTYGKIIEKQRAIIVKDFLASEKSIDLLYKSIHEQQGNVVGIGAIFSGDLVDIYFNMASVYAVFELRDFVHKIGKCPECQKNLPLKYKLED